MVDLNTCTKGQYFGGKVLAVLVIMVTLFTQSWL